MRHNRTQQRKPDGRTKSFWCHAQMARELKRAAEHYGESESAVIARAWTSFLATRSKSVARKFVEGGSDA